MSNKTNKLSGTIAAQASAPGVAGIAVIRVSGELTKKITKKITRKEASHMQAKRTAFFNQDGKKIDDGIALGFFAPNSYTGEDVLEISCHGSPAVVDEILKALFDFGARPAEPGEFTKRAYLNDKIDLVQAEAVADLIESKSIQTARAARRSLEGVFSKKVFTLSDQLTETRTLVEASLDFPDEDLNETNYKKTLSTKLDKTNNAFLSLLKETRTACRIREGATLAIIGEPNVGKSTLMNKLSGHQRAIVSETPGTTRDTIEETILLDGFCVTIVDTAGIRDTKDAIEKEGIERAKKAAKNADIVLEMFDANKREQDTKKPEKNTLLLFNKADLLKTQLKNKNQNEGVFYVSAKDGSGIDDVVSAIAAFFGKSETHESGLTARRRHLNNLGDAFGFFKKAKSKTEANKATDLVAEDLLQAQNTLSEITGEFSTEDLLDKIFSEFCIGK